MSKNIRYRQRLKQRAEAIHGRKCQKCGKTKQLEYAHVKPTGINGHGRGMERRYLDIIKNSGCYMRLCKTCHYDLDFGTTIEDL